MREIHNDGNQLHLIQTSILLIIIKQNPENCCHFSIY